MPTHAGRRAGEVQVHAAKTGPPVAGAPPHGSLRIKKKALPYSGFVFAECVASADLFPVPRFELANHPFQRHATCTEQD